MTIAKKTFYEIPLSIGLAGMNAIGFAETDLVDNTNFGFEQLYVQLKLKTSNVINTESSTLRIYFIESNDSIGSFKYYRLTKSVPITINNSYNTTLWFTTIPPYWGIGVFSDISLSADPTVFNLTSFGVFTQQVDQYFFSYNASGSMGFIGDATETSFPYFYDASGSLALSNVLPIPTVTALGVLSFGGMATVVTPFVQVATGAFRKSGVASGPSAAP